MKPLLTIVFSLGWVAAFGTNALAQETLNQNNANPNNYQGTGAAELLLPVEQRQPFSISLEQQNREIERKALGRNRGAINIEEPRLIMPVCSDACDSPTVAPNNTNEGIGVVLPVQF
ncbi:hypothetical protein NG798_22905 [Ancylothrix sp. C2]|uniref:hypothetical protein n=1 Tax=Ancylothrix sp. D3o TaxID=2953691 RepID=UPI0021BA6728|nr:hypothetical protein [Ancylothrix sp. D3o]MCT7952652.1 hypothetical protein [Ancylothrix sp. D3o]